MRWFLYIRAACYAGTFSHSASETIETSVRKSLTRWSSCVMRSVTAPTVNGSRQLPQISAGTFFTNTTVLGKMNGIVAIPGWRCPPHDGQRPLFSCLPITFPLLGRRLVYRHHK